MKKFLLLSSAIGLCLAAPALAQTTTTQDPMNAPPRAAPPPGTTQSPAQAPPNQAAPARSSQPQSATSGQQQPGGQAQNQQPPAASGSSSPSSAQAPANPPRANANNNNKNQDQNQNQRDRAQNQQPPAASGGSSNSAQAPADRQRSAAPDRNRQSSQADRQQPQSRPPQRDQQQDAQNPRDQRQDAQQRRDQQRDTRNARSRDNDTVRAKVTINDTQRTRIASVIGSARVRPIDVNFRIETGVAVPARVTLAPLPLTIVEIVPQYRGYRYFVTRDERIVIVEPRTKKVVEVISAGSTARAQAADRKVTLTDRQREIILQRTERVPATTGSAARRIVIEEEVPAAVELEEFPAEIVTEVPVVRSYRYFRQDDDVVVVDPAERRVIEIIR